MIHKRALLNPIQADGNRLVGYAAVWDNPYPITEGGRSFTEVVRQGAFSRAIKSGGDIISTFNHSDRLLGRTTSGTLRLSEDGKGLRYEIDLPDHAADIKELVSRGDLRGASMTFTVRGSGEKWSKDKKSRELTDLFLYELGPVIMPASPTTSVGLRSLDYRSLLLDLLSRG